MRSHETHQFSGMMYYTAGVAIVSILFSKTSASIGIMCLACLDPIAALIGSLMQPHLPEARLRNGKSIAGFVFANTTAILVVTLILSQAIQTTMVTTHMFMASVLIAWAGALTELVIPSPQIILGNTSFPIGIDDNVFIPIVCAAVCELVLWLTMDTVILSPILFWDKIW